MEDVLSFVKAVLVFIGLGQVVALGFVTYIGLQIKLLRAQLVSRDFCDDRHAVARQYLDNRYDQVRSEMNTIHVSLGALRAEVAADKLHWRGDA